MLWSSAPIKADIFPNFLNVVFAVVWEPPAKRESVNAAQNRVFRILKTRFGVSKRLPHLAGNQISDAAAKPLRMAACILAGILQSPNSLNSGAQFA